MRPPIGYDAQTNVRTRSIQALPWERHRIHNGVATMRRKVAWFVLLLAAGIVLLAMRPAAVDWRLALLRQKVRGEELGLSWAEVGVRMFPASWGVRRFVDPGPDHWVKKLDYPPGQEAAWRIYNIFAGKTSCLDLLDVHVSTLQAGQLPHDFHHHPEEEILIPISGKVDILRAKDGAGTDQTTERIGYGQFVYHASEGFHTIRGAGPEPAMYLVFKWSASGAGAGGDTALPSSTFEFDASGAAQMGEGFQRKLLFESPTAHLNKLHCHYSTMQPGAGYESHDDAYEVAILLLDGTVETIGEQVSAPSVIFYSAHKAHGMRNRSEAPARYLVFEFHGCGPAGSHEQHNAAMLPEGAPRRERSVRPPSIARLAADGLSRPLAARTQ